MILDCCGILSLDVEVMDAIMLGIYSGGYGKELGSKDLWDIDLYGLCLGLALCGW